MKISERLFLPCSDSRVGEHINCKDIWSYRYSLFATPNSISRRIGIISERLLCAFLILPFMLVDLKRWIFSTPSMWTWQRGWWHVADLISILVSPIFCIPMVFGCILPISKRKSFLGANPAITLSQIGGGRQAVLRMQKSGQLTGKYTLRGFPPDWRTFLVFSEAVKTRDLKAIEALINEAGVDPNIISDQFYAMPHGLPNEKYYTIFSSYIYFFSAGMKKFHNDLPEEDKQAIFKLFERGVTELPMHLRRYPEIQHILLEFRVLQTLLDLGADPAKCKSLNGTSAINNLFRYCIQNSCVFHLKLLMQKMQPNFRDSNGVHGLGYTLISERFDLPTAQFLVQAGTEMEIDHFIELEQVVAAHDDKNYVKIDEVIARNFQRIAEEQNPFINALQLTVGDYNQYRNDSAPFSVLHKSLQGWYGHCYYLDWVPANIKSLLAAKDMLFREREPIKFKQMSPYLNDSALNGLPEPVKRIVVVYL